MNEMQFTCKASHPGYTIDSVLTDTVKLSVHYPPHSIVLMGDKHRNKTENRAVCYAEANPKPYYLFQLGRSTDVKQNTTDGKYNVPTQEKSAIIRCLAINNVFSPLAHGMHISKLITL